MMTVDECFLLFELTPNCTPDELKRAYKRLASEHHPDKGGNTSIFQHIQYAYAEISRYLKNPNSKKTINVTVDMSLEDIFTGKAAYVSVPVNGIDTELVIDIPAGVASGQRIKVADAAIGVDVVLTVKEKPHARIKRDHDNLYIEHAISVFDAMTGATIQISSIDRMLEIAIPPGCENDKVFTYPGLGMNTENGKRGSLYVVITYNAPSITSPSSIALLQSLKNSLTS